MKDIFRFLCCLTIGMLIVSCDKKFTATGASGQVFENYQDACHAQDFEAAHKILAQMKENNSSEYEDAREFIFNQEALFLIAQNDETSTKRLYFLLQEDANEVSDDTRDARCNTIIDLAIKQKNTALVEQTINQYSGIIDRPVMKKIYNYFYTEDHKADKDYILALLQKNECVDIMVADAVEHKNDVLLKEIIDKNALKNATEAALKIAEYAKVVNNRKLSNSLLSNLRTNSQWDSVLEIGLLNGDFSLVKQGYQNSGNKDAAFSKLVSNQNAWSNRSIMQFLLTLVTNEDQAKSLIEICIKDDNADAVVNLSKKFGSKFSESFRDKIIDYAISKNGTSFTDLVVSLLKCTPIEGNPLPAGQRMTSNRPESVVSSHNDYVRSVQSFNRKCDHILSAAIAQHKRVLANKIVSLYKDVPNEYVVNEHWYQIAKTCTYSKDDKLRAQAEVSEAIRRGDL